MKRCTETEVGRVVRVTDKEASVAITRGGGKGDGRRQQPSHLNLPQGGPSVGRRISRDNLKTGTRESEKAEASKARAQLSRSNF